MIRPAGARDARQLAALHAAAFPDPWSASVLADWLAAEGAITLVHPQGFILARAAGGEAEILTLAVRPSARRRGLGRALVEAAADAARMAGAESLFLEVADDNLAALALYARAGFEAVGRRNGYYHRTEGPAVDALVLKRALVPLNA